MQRHLARLVAALPRQTLQRLMAMGGDEVQRHDFLLDISHVMSAETVLRLVESAAHASRRSLSPGLLQLLTKLAAHAERGPAARRAWADQAVREQIRRLVEGWQQSDRVATLPELYEATLDRLPRVAAEDFEPVQVYTSDPKRIVQMSLESGIIEPGTLRAADRMVASRQIASLLDLIETVPRVDPAAQELRARVFHPYSVSVLLTVAPVDLETLDRLVPAAGLEAAGPMLDALAVAKERRVRARMLDLLARFGPPIGGELVARIPGAPWYVQRNLLKLLSTLPALPAGFSTELCLGHPDPRVRHEGLKLLLRDPKTREAAILDSLQAHDAATLRLGLVAALEGCPPAVVPILIRHLETGDLPGDLKALAARAIAPISNPAVLDCLRRLCLSRRIIWRRLAPKSPEMLAALNGLSIHWRDAPRVQPILDLAARQVDREIRDAVWTPPVLRPGAPPPKVLMP